MAIGLTYLFSSSFPNSKVITFITVFFYSINFWWTSFIHSLFQASLPNSIVRGWTSMFSVKAKHFTLCSVRRLVAPALYVRCLNNKMKFFTVKYNLYHLCYSIYFISSETWEITEGEIDGEQFMEAFGHNLSLENCRRLSWAERSQRCAEERKQGTHTESSIFQW